MSPYPPRSISKKTPVTLVTFKKKQTQVQEVKAKVDMLAKKVDKGVSKAFLYGNYDINPASQYTAVNLCNYSTLAPCFNTAAADVANSSKWFRKSMYFDFYITYGNELANCVLTCYLVNLRRNSSLYDVTTGALNALPYPESYIINGLTNAPQAILNPLDFKILKKWNLVTGNNNVAIGTSTGPGGSGLTTNMRKTFTLKIGKYVENPHGDAQDLVCDPDSTKQMYLLIFTDNLGIDGEYPKFHLNVLHSLEIPN